MSSCNDIQEMKTAVVSLLALSSLLATSSAFSSPLHSSRTHSNVILRDKDLERDIEEKSLRNARGGGGEVAAGAILGGLIGGPFGTFAWRGRPN